MCLGLYTVVWLYNLNVSIVVDKVLLVKYRVLHGVVKYLYMSSRPLTTSMIKPDPKNIDAAGKLIQGKLLHASGSIQEEVKRVLKEKGVSLDYLIDKYKKLSDSTPDKITGSDILKSLDTMMRLLGVKTEDDQTVLKVGAILQEKTPTELRTFIMELTTKTQSYLNKVREPVDNNL